MIKSNFTINGRQKERRKEGEKEGQEERRKKEGVGKKFTKKKEYNYVKNRKIIPLNAMYT